MKDVIVRPMDCDNKKIDPRIRGERHALLYCQRALDALARDHDRVRSIAISNITLWERERTCSPFYPQTWRSLLDKPLAHIRGVVLADTDQGQALRSNHPFAGVFSVAEARSIRRAADACDEPS